MKEADREAVLSEYFRMFEEADDDFAVIEQLVSPTRAAVTVLRDYKPSPAPEADAAPGPSGEDGAPAVAELPATEAAPSIEAAPPAKPEPSVPEAGPAPMHAVGEVSSAGGSAAAPLVYEAYEEAQPEEVVLPDQISLEDLGPAPDADLPAPPVDDEVLPDQISLEDAEAEEPDTAIDRPETPDEPEATGMPDAPEEAPAVEPASDSETQTGNDAPPEDAADEDREDVMTIVTQPPDAVFVEYVSPEDEDDYADGAAQSERAPEGALSVGRAVLYTLFGIVVGIPATLALFMADLVFLGLGIGAVSAAVITISLAFVGLNVIADIMLLIGAGTMMAALGLPLIALSIWGFPRYVVGFVRYVIRKGREWCRAKSDEEVAEEW